MRLHGRSAEVSPTGILNIMALLCYVRYTGARGFNRKEGNHKTQGRWWCLADHCAYRFYAPMRRAPLFDLGCVARFKPGTSRAACRLLAVCVSVLCHLQDSRRSCRLLVWAILERTGNVYATMFVQVTINLETKQSVQKGISREACWSLPPHVNLDVRD